jgi:hypothetical protein
LKKEKEKRIPTIFDESKLTKKGYTRFPTKSDVESVRERIRQTKDLYPELKKIGIDIENETGEGLCHLIALNSHFKEEWQAAHIASVRARDRAKKVKKRWDKDDKRLNKYGREKQLKVLTGVIAREHFTKNDASRINCLTKEHPYLQHFLHDLKYLFKSQKTPRPYRFIAGIINFFNFHPENFCKDCNKFHSKEEKCLRQKVFLCPKHKQARDKIYRLFKDHSLN